MVLNVVFFFEWGGGVVVKQNRGFGFRFYGIWTQKIRGLGLGFYRVQELIFDLFRPNVRTKRLPRVRNLVRGFE